MLLTGHAWGAARVVLALDHPTPAQRRDTVRILKFRLAIYPEVEFEERPGGRLLVVVGGKVEERPLRRRLTSPARVSFRVHHGAPLRLGAGDVVACRAVLDEDPAWLRIMLSPSAAARMEAFSRAHRGERVGLFLDEDLVMPFRLTRVLSSGEVMVRSEDPGEDRALAAAASLMAVDPLPVAVSVVSWETTAEP